MLLFPDTNFFLQCLSPAEIPWGDITTDNEICLFVCRTVQSEIDRLKNDGKLRRAQRARMVSSWFASIIDGGVPTVFRADKPKVTLDLPPRISPGHSFPSSLDISRNDNAIVGEVLAYNSESAVLLTDDTNMKLTARDVGLKVFNTPDKWRLPAEPDHRDKQISDLQKQVARLERSQPVIVVTVTSAAPLKLEKTCYEPLNLEFIEELLSNLQSHYPMKVDFSREADPSYIASMKLGGYHVPGLTVWQAPSPKAIEKYHFDYTHWIKSVRKHFENLNRLLTRGSQQIDFRWAISNTGTIPADGFIVEVETLGNLALIDPKLPPKSGSPNLPEAPEVPGWKEMFTGLANFQLYHDVVNSIGTGPAWSVRSLESVLVRNTQEPQTFYRRESQRKAMTRKWTFECADFRHLREPENFHAIIHSLDGVGAFRGAVRIRAFARNLPDLVEKIVPVTVIAQAAQTVSMARECVAKLTGS